MSGDIEGIGTLAEGALVARAVEPGASGNGAKADQAEGSCLNCGTVLIGAYCHACGQSAHVHRSIAAFWHDILHGVLHFEGKFWRTLPLLVWRPGELTRRYIHGERARFISPMALFLFAIFLMFALFSFTGSGSKQSQSQQTEAGSLAEARADLDRQIQQKTEAIEALPANDPSRATLEAEREELRRGRAAVGMINGVANGAGLPVDANAPFEADTGVAEFDAFIEKAAQKANANPELLLYKLKSNGYKFAWLLIPLSIPVVWLVTIGKRGLRFYDHAVFTTYSIAFMSLLFIVATLASRFALAEGPVTALCVLYAPAHMYRQLRHAYGFSRFGTLVRLTLLLIGIILVLALFLALLLAMGLMG